MKQISYCISILTISFSIILFCIGCTKNNLFIPEIADYPHKSGINKLFKAADEAKYNQDYRKSAALFRGLLSVPLSTADSQYLLNQLAYVHLSMNEDSAAEHWIQLLSDKMRPLSKDALADYNYNIGVLNYHTFKIDTAKVYLQTALENYKQVYGKNHLRVAQCLTELGMMYYDFIKADSTISLIQQADSIFNTHPSLKRYKWTCELGKTYINIINRSHSDGEKRCENAIISLTTMPFFDTLLIARFYCMKGFMLKKQGQKVEKEELENKTNDTKSKEYFKSAETNFKEAVALGQAKPTIRLQEFYRELIINYVWLDDSIAFNAHIKQLETLLMTQPDIFGQPDRLKGYYYFEKKDDFQSNYWYSKFIKHWRKHPLRETKILIEAYNSLAKSSTNLGQFDAALDYLKEAHFVGTEWEGKRIETDDFLKTKKYQTALFSFVTINWMGEILLKKYNKTKDFSTLLSAFDAFIITDDLLFPGIQTASEESILTYQKDVADKAYTLGLETIYALYTKTKKPIYLDYAFKFCEKSKAFLLYRNMQEKDTNIIKLSPPQYLLDKIRQLESEEKLLSVQKIYKSTNPQKFIDINQDLEALKNKVAKEYPQYYRLKTTQPVDSLSKVQAILRKQQQAVIHYIVSEHKIHSLFISGETVVFNQIIDSSLQEEIKSYNSILVDDTKMPSVEAYSQLALSLYNKLIKHLSPHFQKLKGITIMPDRLLNSIPFESLITRNMPIGKPKSYLDLPYFVYDIPINYSPAWKIYHRNNNKSFPSNPSIWALSYGNQPTIKENLSNAMDEITAVTTAMPQSKVLNAVGKECTKDQFLASAANFDILHLSLHAASNMGDKNDNKIYFQIPLNDALYGYDIAKLHLKACLVVLSACETAKGKTESSEGAFTLTRSFLQSGVNTVVASLWNISDATTSQIMPYFYQNLAQKYTPSVSLHKAKVAFLKKNADEKKAFPRYWAPLICIE
jgi:CHAT domain-containing protein